MYVQNCTVSLRTLILVHRHFEKRENGSGSSFQFKEEDLLDCFSTADEFLTNE